MQTTGLLIRRISTLFSLHWIKTQMQNHPLQLLTSMTSQRTPKAESSMCNFALTVTLFLLLGTDWLRQMCYTLVLCIKSCFVRSSWSTSWILCTNTFHTTIMNILIMSYLTKVFPKKCILNFLQVYFVCNMYNDYFFSLFVNSSGTAKLVIFVDFCSYQKFLKGKDLSGYHLTDLNCIFGERRKQNASETEKQRTADVRIL